MADSTTAPGPPPSRIAVKICGLVRRVDALHAAEAGADYLGVVLVPQTPRVLTQREARAVLYGIQVPSVIVVADLPISQVEKAAQEVGACVIQLHGEESPQSVGELRDAGPWNVWKALRVRGNADVLEGLARFEGMTDGLLLDGWHPERKGGTGTAFSWDDVGGIRDFFPPGMLIVAAGGLGPENVLEAAIKLRPHVVDVSSGVEEKPGVKNHARVEAFIQTVRAAEAGERS